MRIVADADIPFINEFFASAGDLILKPGRQMKPADVKDADLLIVRSITPVNEALLKNSRVQFVGSVTAGLDHLDLNWLAKNNITVRSAAGFNAPPVADYVVSIIAALERKGLFLRKHKRAAIVGVGYVGRLVAERLRLLGVDVLLCDPLRAENEADFNSIPLTELADLDLISLHVPLTHDGAHPTYHMINEDFLQRQKTGCILVNASRGAVMDTEAFMRAGAHLHACFDVWEHEPHIDKEVLQTVFIATPHIAGYSVQSKLRGVEMIFTAACELGLITKATSSPVVMPMQTLQFAGLKHHWQDVVLGIFNPLIMTAMMREKLLPAADTSDLFDHLRRDFTYRHEFAYTEIKGLDLPETDRVLLEKMGMRFSEV
ncbi:MAG: hypothetical protein A3F14_00565 [Gammaproteobacteria bacterium RIFCSPHIGHO2_12_FULL_43_28]|nr:MAG: hypothetical protein A3F14_00565 [Gammaproteobacteria bacterium RIFCSPHIGHO2_12_FULL_43_28]